MPSSVQRRVHRLLRCTLFVCFIGSFALYAQSTARDNWPTYGDDQGGQRFSTSTQITKANVTSLRPVWTFHTHVFDTPRVSSGEASFEATPVLRGERLYFTSPYDQVFAVDAIDGHGLWSYDPQVHAVPEQIITSRGVALWPAGPTSPQANTACSTRVFVGTLDARLLALDADTGKLCEDFGHHGSVDLTVGLDTTSLPGYGVTSPPAVIGNVVIIGSTIGDNQQTEVESGMVHAFDVMTGALIWSWEPLPWRTQTHPRVGAANTWSIISVDPQLGLVFLPTSSPSLDYYGVPRSGDNRDADSIVALDAATGHRVWAFQTVHHNLWDYDVPSEPLLFTIHPNTPQAIPALAVTTKTAQVFVLDRRTGAPLYTVDERPVPQSDIPGEHSWPTQPFSSLPPLTSFSPALEPASGSGWHRDASNAEFCNQQLRDLRYEGPFTPPSVHGTLLFPGNLGGVNWGGAALDPATNVLYANVNRIPFRVRLVPRNSLRMIWRRSAPTVRDWPLWLEIAGAILLVSIIIRSLRAHFGKPAEGRPWLPSKGAAVCALLVAMMSAIVTIFPMTPSIPHFGYELSEQTGSPYLLEREPIVDHNNLPCSAPPWGALTAINLENGQLAFQSPLGTRVAQAQTGAISFGGPIVTSAGLVFTAGTQDAHLRAFDAASGAELWSTPLPASGRATPMTYTLRGRQYVVIAAGGHGGLAEHQSDSLVAFALP